MLIDSDLIKWVLAVAVAVMGWFLKKQDNRITKLEEHSGRVTTLEAHYVDIMNRLSRIENKLDRLSE